MQLKLGNSIILINESCADCYKLDSLSNGISVNVCFVFCENVWNDNVDTYGHTLTES